MPQVKTRYFLRLHNNRDQTLAILKCVVSYFDHAIGQGERGQFG